MVLIMLKMQYRIITIKVIFDSIDLPTDELLKIDNILTELTE